MVDHCQRQKRCHKRQSKMSNIRYVQLAYLRDQHITDSIQVLIPHILTEDLSGKR